MPKRDAVLTVSALARLHGLDRRTVERRLIDVKPTRTRRVGGRAFRYYRSADIGQLFDGSSVAEAWEELLGLRADLLEIKRSIRRQESIPCDVAQHELAKRIIAAKTNYRVLPGKLCERLAHLDRAGQAVLIVEELKLIESELAEPFPWEKR